MDQPTDSPLNALTFDVEDYYQVSAFEQQVARDSWGDYESRVVDSTSRLLDILSETGTRATFFVLGWVAERFPQLVREIHAAGHEVGSHSHWHRLVYSMSPFDFRMDLRQSCVALEDAIGQKVTTYRAPSFSITTASRWAFDVLAEEGFCSDSSVFPIYHDRYGVNGAPCDLHRVQTASGTIWEFPMSVANYGPVNLPISGGGYFRLYPLAVTNRYFRRLNRAGKPFVFYLHPWEIDPAQPRLNVGSKMSRWRHTVNLHSTESKLRRLLKMFRFGPLRDVIANGSASIDGVQTTCSAEYPRSLTISASTH